MHDVGCSPPEADTKYSPIDDVAGGGGRTIETSDQACSVRCIATPGCAHWSRWSADGTGGCHLSPDNATRVPYKGATSGSESMTSHLRSMICAGCAPLFAARSAGELGWICIMCIMCILRTPFCTRSCL